MTIKFTRRLYIPHFNKLYYYNTCHKVCKGCPVVMYRRLDDMYETAGGQFDHIYKIINYNNPKVGILPIKYY